MRRLRPLLLVLILPLAAAQGPDTLPASSDPGLYAEPPIRPCTDVDVPGCDETRPYHEAEASRDDAGQFYVAPSRPRQGADGPHAGGPVMSPALAAAQNPATWAGLTALAVAIGLYHRFRGQRVLQHPVRDRILARVRSQPGIVATDVARENGLTLNAILYHVRVLEREGHVRVRRVGRSGLLFPASVTPADREAYATLRAPLARAVLAYACARGQGSIREAAAALGASERSTREQAARLERAGLIVRDRTRPGGGLRPTQAALAFGPSSALDDAAGAAPAQAVPGA